MVGEKSTLQHTICIFLLFTFFHKRYIKYLFFVYEMHQLNFRLKSRRFPMICSHARYANKQNYLYLCFIQQLRGQLGSFFCKIYCKCNFSMTWSVRLLVGWSAGRSVGLTVIISMKFYVLMMK